MDGGLRIARAWARRPRAALAAVLLALGTAACTTDGQPTPVAATPRGPTVAFESIDGPPESIFHRLVHNLAAEAEARQLAVVSREAAAHYRVKAYLATIVDPKRSVITWVWDVYDAQEQRALRISGAEPVTGAGRTTWAAAEEHVLRRIAATGMDRLAAYLATPRAPAPATPPATDRSVTVAAVAER